MAEDLHYQPGEAGQAVATLVMAPYGLQHGPPRTSFATARRTATAARPTWRAASMSPGDMIDIRPALMVSFAMSGQPNSSAMAWATTVLPLAAGPETTT